MSSSDDSSNDATSSFEGVRGYGRKGGFFAVSVGNTLNGAWTVKSKLGFGRFSTTWSVSRDGRESALKIHRASADWWKDEVDLLRKVRNEPCVLQIDSSFELRGDNGTHGCIVTERLGRSLRDVMRSCELPGWVRQGVARDLLTGLASLHRHGIVHTDIKPDNVLFRGWVSDYLVGPPPPGRVYVSKKNRRRGAAAHVAENPATVPRDLSVDMTDDVYANGGFCVVADLGNAELVGEYPPNPGSIQARGYRSPESVLYIHHTEKADIFSAGILIHELTSPHLFDADAETSELSALMLVKMMRRTLGPFPGWMIRAAPSFAACMVSTDDVPCTTPIDPFVRKLLALDPYERLSAEEALIEINASSPMRVD
jgi:serine/threonine-protein kinase SRPK3